MSNIDTHCSRKLAKSSVPWLFFVALAGTLGAAGDPAFYSRKAHWTDTIIASPAALAPTGLTDQFKPFTSKIMRGGDTAVSVRIDRAGAPALFLFVTGCPDVAWGVADWGRCRFARGHRTVKKIWLFTR